jgi:hypothetical protein
MAGSPDEAHYWMIADRILAGDVIPFLGGGVNLCGRPESGLRGREYLPSGSELADYLARKSGYPSNDRSDLLRVAQYIELMMGHGPLYALLHAVFDADYPPTPAHKLLASLPSLIRARPGDEPRTFPLILTMNYDDSLERAFTDEGEAYDLVTYIADGRQRGRFLHTTPEGVARVISEPASYKELRCDERSVITKLSGSVARDMAGYDSYVITEDDYIDYLSYTDLPDFIPVNILARMKQSHFLFLGYSLKDWNLRVILRRLWGDAGAEWNSWAVQLNPDTIEARSWGGRGVEVLDARLETYIDLLGAALISPSRTTGELS